MSSTGRCADRQPDDFYVTPRWATEAVLPFLPRAGVSRIVDPGAGTGAITMVLREAYPNAEIHAIERDEKRAQRVHDRLSLHGAPGKGWGIASDFEIWTANSNAYGDVDLVVGNPPYNDAAAFVDAALALVGPTGTVAMLLRLAWIASQKRRAFHQQHPSDLVVLSKRPSFCASFKCSCGERWTEPAGTKSSNCPREIPGEATFGAGRSFSPCTGKVRHTDSADYAWFIWGPGPRGRVSVVA